MSILIKGLDVTALNDDSSVCYKDIRLFADGSATTSSGEHPYIKTFEWVEVPTSHGDLIDRDALIKQWEKEEKELGLAFGIALIGAMNEMKEFPIVIESEE